MIFNLVNVYSSRSPLSNSLHIFKKFLQKVFKVKNVIVIPNYIPVASQEIKMKRR